MPAIWTPAGYDLAQAVASRRARATASSVATQTSIPAQTVLSVRRPEKSLVVWAVQRGLNAGGATLTEDSKFGLLTHQAVKLFQRQHDLAVDGIFGQASSSALSRDLERQASLSTVTPDGMLHGLVDGESSSQIGAVNWQTPGGADCSLTMRRVYAADYGNAAIERRAFDALYQLKLAASTLRGRHDRYYGEEGAKSHEKAWRLAVLAHNYPYAAQEIALKGSWITTYSTSPQPWVQNIGAKFPDGVRVETPLQWCGHYSLGSTEHNDPGMMVRFVSAWTA